MTEKNDEPANIRAHLLSIEPPNVERLQQLQKEIQAMFNKPLTTAGRASWIVTLAGSVAFVGVGVLVLLRSHEADVSTRANWGLLSFLMLVNAIVAVRVLKRGVFNLREMSALQKFSVPATLAAAILLIVQAIDHPSIIALGWALFGVIWVVVSLAVTVYNRVVAAELNTRESLLRLELRMVELADSRIAK